MANFSAQDFIQKARAQNIPDEAIYSFLQSKGLLNQTNAPDFKATPGNTTLGPSGTGLLSKIGAGITSAGIGIGSVVGQTGLGLGKLAVQGVGAAAGMMGAKGVQQGANNVAGDIQGVSNAMYNSPQVQKQTANIPGMVGKGVGTLATLVAPEGLEAKAGQAVQDVTDMTKIGPKAAGAIKVATKAATSGASMGTITAAQGGPTKEAVGLGVVSGGLSEALSAFGKPFAEALQKGDFKLTPLQSIKAAKKVDDAAKFMTDNGILGTGASKLKQLTNLNKSLEDTLQTGLPKTVAISKKTIIDSIQHQISELVNIDPAEHPAAANFARRAIATLNKSEGSSINGSINAETALNGKRSFGSMAFKTSKNTDPNVSSQGAFIVETAYQKALNDALEKTNSTIAIPKELQPYFGGKENVSLQEFNKVYSSAISAKNLTYLSQGRSGVHLIGRLAGLYIGEIVGQTIMPGVGGKLFGMLGGEAASNFLAPGLRMAGEGAYASAPAIPGATKAAQAGITTVSSGSN